MEDNSTTVDARDQAIDVGTDHDEGMAAAALSPQHPKKATALVEALEKLKAAEASLLRGPAETETADEPANDAQEAADEPANDAQEAADEPAPVVEETVDSPEQSAPEAVDQPAEDVVMDDDVSDVGLVAPADVAAVETLDEPAIVPAGADDEQEELAPLPEFEPVGREDAFVRPVHPSALGDERPVVLAIEGLRKRFGSNVAVDGVTLDVRQGSFYGIVGPNGAGKTTTLSIVTGLLRPDSGTVTVHGADVWKNPDAAKKVIGVLPDRLRLFDRLTGAQLLYYSGVLRGLDAKTVRARSADLSAAFGLDDAMSRLVVDYSAGMTKKVALAAAMIHSPRLLVLDEPFESVDPVSAANVIEILQKYVQAGGTVVLSSHGMDLIQRVCDSVAIIVGGQVLDAGTVDEVRGEQTLEERFVDLAGGRRTAEGMEWLHNFSD